MNPVPPLLGLAVSRVALVALVLIWGTASLFGAKYPAGTVVPEVKLSSGTVLHEVKVVAIGTTTIVASWTGGRGTILLSELPPEMRDGLTSAAAPKLAATSAPIQPAAAGAASVELPSDIRLTSGFVMHRSVVTR